MSTTIQALHPVLVAADIPESLAFYKKLGFTPSFQDDPSTPRYAAIQRDNIELHLQWADEQQWAYPTDRPAYRFLVADVDALYREFTASDAVNPTSNDHSPWHAPADTPWGTREFHLRDPGKNILQFYRSL